MEISLIDGLYEKISEIRSDGYPCSNPILHLLKKKTEAETSLPRDYAEIAASGILRAVTEYNSISFYADGDTVSGFHYELLHAFAHSKGLKPEITPEMSFLPKDWKAYKKEHTIYWPTAR